nr:hypothetical protein [Burkholderia stabilis]
MTAEPHKSAFPLGLFIFDKMCLHQKRDKMIRTLLNDEVWAQIASVLPGREGDPGWMAADNRWFFEAALGIGRTGRPWRNFPKEESNNQASR